MRSGHVKALLLTACLVAIGLLPAAAQGDGTGHAAHSVLGEGTWYRLAIPATGIYGVTTDDVAALAGVSTGRVGVYGQPGGMLNEDNAVARPDDLPQLAATVVDNNGNGVFDAGDRLVFYAQGADAWRYGEDSLFHHERNGYENNNYVFLRLDGTAKRLPTAAAIATPGAPISHGDYRAVHDVDEVNTHEGGIVWVGERFGTGTAERTIAMNLPGAPRNNVVNVAYALASLSPSATFSVNLNGGGEESVSFSKYKVYVSRQKSFSANGTSLNFNIAYHTANAGIGYLDYVEVNAQTPLLFQGGQTTFRNVHTADGNATYTIANATSAMQVWDVTDYDSAFAVPLSQGSGTATFTAPHASIREYIAFDGSSYLSPSAAAAVENQDLHGTENPDMVIVANAAYLSQARAIASLHEVYDNLRTMVVTDRQVFNEFSGGKQDPMALREMMRMFYKRHAQNSALAAPRYLLLFGKGSYDNRDILKKNATTVVTYVSQTSFSEDNAYSSDDLFGYLDDDESGNTYESLDLSIGRLPAKSKAEADLFVKKITNYMTRADLSDSTQRGDWRNTITLLADDADPSQGGDTVFATSMEALSKHIAYKYPQYNFEKIYADAYPQQSGAIGSYYPDVNNALRKRLDYGTLLFNYIGHGSPQYIGTERYVELNDISGYKNIDRLFFFVSSTCSYGRYDMLDNICGAEALVLASGGAIGAISAGRPISHVERFNTDVCYTALDPAYSVGDALRYAKNRTAMPHCILLLGDPAIHLSMPQNKVVVTAINGKAVEDNVADSALVLSTVTIEGEIRNSTGEMLDDFAGTLFPIVYDRPTTVYTLANDNEGTEIKFSQQKSVIYKGRAEVRNGRFAYSFTVPRDVRSEFDYAKLSHFAKSNGGDAATGAYKDLALGGFDETVSLGETRPSVRLFMGDSNFRSGGTTGQSPYLFAILEDSIGINAAGCGLGHDITCVLDNNGNDVVVLNDFFETDISNPRRGYVHYGFQDLAPGPHVLALKAWNIFNYSTEATVKFVVKGADTNQCGAFYSYPNPATDKASIVLEFNNSGNIRSAMVEIFDQTGRLMARLEPRTNEQSSVVGPVVWNCATATNGVYVARATVTTTNGETHSAITKIVKAKQ